MKGPRSASSRPALEDRSSRKLTEDTDPGCHFPQDSGNAPSSARRGMRIREHYYHDAQKNDRVMEPEHEGQEVEANDHRRPAVAGSPAQDRRLLAGRRTTCRSARSTCSTTRCCEKPLKREHIKPRLLGHWGTTPGLNLLYVHLNRVIKQRRPEHDLHHRPRARRPGAGRPRLPRRHLQRGLSRTSARTRRG